LWRANSKPPVELVVADLAYSGRKVTGGDIKSLRNMEGMWQLVMNFTLGFAVEGIEMKCYNLHTFI
ncbi:MAG: hypothetical protein LUI10_05900, partial [Lachnospiraceae bacterium]|nr:hypothetical protein [Lachnospiraceae bacterium]